MKKYETPDSHRIGEYVLVKHTYIHWTKRGLRRS